MMTRYIIVGVIMFAYLFLLLWKLLFKPKKHDCSSDCGECGGCD